MLHKSVVVRAPVKPSVRAGIARGGVGTSLPAPHGIRRPDPASGEGKLTASVQQKNDVGNSAVGTLSSVRKLLVGVANGTASGSLTGCQYLLNRQSVALSGAGTATIVSTAEFDRVGYMDSPATLEAAVWEQYERDIADSGVGSLSVASLVKYSRTLNAVTVGTLTAESEAPGATYTTDANTGTTGSLGGFVGVADDAQLAGDGVTGILEASFGAKFDVPLSASGTLSTSGVAQFNAASYASGSGELLAIGKPKSLPAVSAAGALTVGAKVNPGGPLTGAGVLAASAVIQTTVPMGMDKSAVMALPASTWTKLTGWTTRSGYPATTITNNALVVSANGNYRIYYRILFGGVGISTNNKGARVLVNGGVVHTTQATGAAGSDVYRMADFTQTLTAGDVVTIEGFHASSGAANREIQSGASNTYLFFDAV